MNRRVFLLMGNALCLYEWQDKKLLGTYTFSYDDDGFSQFKKTMAALPVCPAQLLVSIPNEDFYREKVPHVRKSERELVVKRYVKKHFRDEKYTNVVFQSREKVGRKDDIVLISSIGNSDEFDQWLSLLHEVKVPLIGIWSAPLFYDTLLKEPLATDRHVIFVNRERHGNYRQSLFVDGVLILSRVTDSIKQSKKINDKVNAINDFIVQLYKFSTNKRILSFDSQVLVLCAFDEVPLENLREVSTLDNVDYKPYDPDSLSLDKQLVSQCIKDRKNKPHYVTDQDRFEYSIVKKNTNLYQVLALVSFFMFASSGAVAIKAFDNYRNANFNYQSSLDLEKSYRSDFASVDQYLTYANKSKELVDEIVIKQFDADQMPTDLFPGLSSVLSMDKFSELVSNKILWKRYAGKESKPIKKLFEKNDPPQKTVSSGSGQAKQADEEHIYIHISGDYFVDNISYDQAIGTMNDFERELNKIAGINAVYMLRVPVDLRADSRFIDDGGFLARESGRFDEPSAFEFILEYRRE